MGMLSMRGRGLRKLSRQQDLWGMQADVRVRKAQFLGGSLGKVEGWKRPLGQQRFRKSHSLSIGLFSYTLRGYKERLNVQQMSFSLHLFVLIDKSLFCVGQFDHLLNLSFLLSCHGNVLECPEFIFLFYLIL